MPPFGPVDRKDLIRHLRKIGFQGPFSGGRHAFMVHVSEKQSLPRLKS
ncbi:MAG: YcfA-like protein [Magnetococcales bacterium]|nr:YcfA-like protein [Magnetococcales bacterium]